MLSIFYLVIYICLAAATMLVLPIYVADLNKDIDGDGIPDINIDITKIISQILILILMEIKTGFEY